MTAGTREGPSAGAGIWAWDIYWQADRLHSCVPVNNPANAAELAAAWRRFFMTLPAGARIVDLGSGNGAVASIAAEVNTAEKRGFEIHGVDAAAIDPVRFAASERGRLEQVAFHGRTFMEDLPFADESVDAMTGQYALEYADTERAIGEILRVLAQDAPFRFLVHDREGALIERGRLHRSQAERILESPLFEVLRTSFRAGTNRDAVRTVHRILGDLDRAFAKAPDRSLPDNLLQGVARLVAMRGREAGDRLLDLADDMERRLSAQAERLRALDAAALDRAGLNRLEGEFSRRGAVGIESGRASLGAKSTPVGWWLTGRKA